MKRFLLSVALLSLAAGAANAQILKFGIRGGASSSQVKMKDLANVRTQINGQDTAIVLNLATNTPMGFHLGFFSQISLGGLYVMPELLFATTGGETTVTGLSAVGQAWSKNVRERNLRIDIPVIVGAKLGPARLGLGPVASFNLISRDDLADVLAEAAGAQQTTKADDLYKTAVWGLQFDAGVNILGKVAVDLKYELGLSKLGDKVQINGNDYN